MRVTGHFDYFREEVSKIADVTPIFKSTAPYLAGKWSKLMMNRQIKPKRLVTKKLANKGWDFVMIDALFGYMDDRLNLLRAPKALVIEDNHAEVPRWQVLQGKDRGVENLFHRGLESFHRFHPTARENYNCVWLPFAVNPDMFKPIDTERTIPVIQVGTVNERHYPLRVRLKKELNGWSKYTFIQRPGETVEKVNKWPIREDYAELLAQARIAVTCGSRYDAAVQKYLEIPACGTVLMSNWFKDLKSFGFENGKNIVVYEKDIRGQLELMLKNPERLERIGNAGRQLVLERHTLKKRAKYFIKEVEKIVNEQS
jgi:glycosyltransferase involved in cell wall biosynthesis